MGQSVFVTVGRDAIVSHMRDFIYKFKMGEGGFIKSELVTEEIPYMGSSIVYNIGGGEFSIINIDQGAREFTVSGELSLKLVVGAKIRVEDSDNIGIYTVASFGVSGVNNTLVEVEESIPSVVVEGKIILDVLPICKGPTSAGVLHHSLAIRVYEDASPVQVLEDVGGIGVLTQTSGSGFGEGTINYKTGLITLSGIVSGTGTMTVFVEYKYANTNRSPVPSKTMLDSEGDSSLYTFEKILEEDDFVLRGPGYATLRVNVELSESEAIDDGLSSHGGGIPFFFEGGLYDEEDVLLLYFTFEKTKKYGSVTVSHTVDVKI